MTDSTFGRQHHPDPIDRASDLEMLNTADAIAVVRAKVGAGPKQLPDEDGNYPEPDCQGCGEEIPLARLKVAANNVMCIVCAAAAERRKR